MSRAIFCLMAVVAFFSCQPPTNAPQENGLNKQDTASKPAGPASAAMPKLDQPVSADQLISPGKGIGHISVGNDADSAVQQLGKPDFEDAAMGKELVTWYANHDSTSYQTSIYITHNMGGKDESRAYIKKVFITSPWFRTAEKLGVGSTLDQLSAHFSLRPVQAYAMSRETVKLYNDTDKGISFEIKLADKTCIGIIVNKPHEDPAVYLNLREK